MDMTRLELMRIPFATVLFVSSVFMLWTYFGNTGNLFDDSGSLFTIAGALVCIGVLVYSIVLYANLDAPANKRN